MDIVREVAEQVAVTAVADISSESLSETSRTTLSQASPEELAEVIEAIKERLPLAIEWALASVIDGVENRRGSPLEKTDVPPPVRPF